MASTESRGLGGKHREQRAGWQAQRAERQSADSPPRSNRYSEPRRAAASDSARVTISPAYSPMYSLAASATAANAPNPFWPAGCTVIGSACVSCSDSLGSSVGSLPLVLYRMMRSAFADP